MNVSRSSPGGEEFELSRAFSETAASMGEASPELRDRISGFGPTSDEVAVVSPARSRNKFLFAAAACIAVFAGFWVWVSFETGADTKRAQPASSATAPSIPNQQPQAVFVPNAPTDDNNPISDDSDSPGRYPVSANPIPAGYPNPSSTGLAAADIEVSKLTPRTGLLEITIDGTVIDGIDLDGPVHIKANDVQIRNSRVTSSANSTVWLHPGFEGLQVTNSRIRSEGAESSAAIFLQGSAILQKVHASGGANVLQADGSNIIVENSYLVAPTINKNNGADIVQVRSGSNYRFSGNSLVSAWKKGNSVLLIQADAGPVRDVVIENNYISGGGYSINTLTENHVLEGGVVKDNRIESGSWLFGWKNDNTESNYSGNQQLPS